MTIIKDNNLGGSPETEDTAFLKPEHSGDTQSTILTPEERFNRDVGYTKTNISAFEQSLQDMFTGYIRQGLNEHTARLLVYDYGVEVISDRNSAGSSNFNDLQGETVTIEEGEALESFNEWALSFDTTSTETGTDETNNNDGEESP